MIDTPPGPISNKRLLTADGQPRSGLLRGTHYRGVNEGVWNYLFAIYGGGPALMRNSIDIYEPPPPVSSAVRSHERGDNVEAEELSSLGLASAAGRTTSNSSISQGAFNDRTD